jgi:pimeloyl-ACP methyl ester carboxylesterase
MQDIEFVIKDKPFHAITAGDREKPLLLFLHGFPEYCGAWADVLPNFADEYYCVAPDQRGYGQSWRGGDVADYAAKHLAADALAMIDMFGGGKAAALLGHDWGASVAYACAMRAPEKMEKLVIANGVHPAPFQKGLAAGGPQAKASQYIEWLRQDGSEKALVANDFERMFGLFAKYMDMSWLTEEKQKAYRAAWRDEDGVRGMVNWYRATPLLVAKPDEPIPANDLPQWDQEALRIRVPHLLLWGMGDKALTPETRDGLKDYCDDLTMVERRDADHWIIHQHPEWVADQIKTFLNRP